MNLKVNHIPDKWDRLSSTSFAKWFIDHIKSKHELKEDYQLLKRWQNLEN